ncbi:class I adenylate-forming enzyme family protein [Alloalcanivorax marinus]|uniref:class I adenylate-forming enzyme family protein n=1 Tax=Alloalcanivorax marinus TaxID=1177169 RepID=UPI001932E293|nr:class I adenylate-forming enzyme family protein [Alloalcanivorax marinus]MBL7251046.1 acyl--CoA ligase [Alloalcanivorax marinus]
MTSISDAMPVYAPSLPEDDFVSIPQRLQELADRQPDHPAVHDETGTLTWREFVDGVNRVANRLRAAGLSRGDTVAGLSENNARYLTLFMGTLTAGGCMVPLSGMAAGETLALMINDCDARFLFVSDKHRTLIEPLLDSLHNVDPAQRVALDFQGRGWLGFEEWLGDAGAGAPDHTPSLNDPFNIIYSSGTTGVPKGILHDHRLRARHVERGHALGYDQSAVTLVSTPLYSNTTLVAVLPTLFGGGTIVSMAKFNAHRFLELAEEYRATHAMLVPVQYQRILAEPDFDRFDLSSFKMKFSTSAPLRGHVIADAMKRWPGNIIEFYGLTEGGVTTTLNCAENPTKWDTVGKASPGCELRIIDEDLKEVPAGEIGEIVGRSGAMMRGYYKREGKTNELLWTSPDGEVFYRTGDMGRLDEDGFLSVLDRRKDMIISGGFNIYAEDLERVLLKHEAVADAAVIAIPSEQWGETPLGLVVLAEEADTDLETILEWANERLGKGQRLSGLERRDELPRSTIGKILKRELRDPYWKDREQATRD